MSANHRLPSLETRPLLDQRPSSYDSTNDVNLEAPSPVNTEPLHAAVNNNPRIDLWWILAGLWMGVMLGAFDGMYRP